MTHRAKFALVAALNLYIAFALMYHHPAMLTTNLIMVFFTLLGVVEAYMQIERAEADPIRRTQYHQDDGKWCCRCRKITIDEVHVCREHRRHAFARWLLSLYYKLHERDDDQ